MIYNKDKNKPPLFSIAAVVVLLFFSQKQHNHRTLLLHHLRPSTFDHLDLFDHLQELFSRKAKKKKKFKFKNKKNIFFIENK